VVDQFGQAGDFKRTGFSWMVDIGVRYHLNDTIFDIASKLQKNLSYLLSFNDLSCDTRLYPDKRTLFVPPLGIGSYNPPDIQIDSHNVDSLEQFHTLECMKNVSDLAFSPSGEILAVASGPSIYLWRVSDWQPLYRIEEHLARITTIAFSPDGKQLSSGSINNSVRIWSLETNEQLQELHHGNEITDLAYSPDGKQLVVTSLEKKATVYNVANWEQLHSFQGYQTTSAAYSPDGKVLAIAYTDRVDVFDSQDFNLRQSLEPQRERDLIGQNLLFSSNGLLLATSNNLWQISDGRQIYHWEEKLHRTLFTSDLEALFIGPRIVRLRNGKTIRELETLVEGAIRKSYDFDSIAISPDKTLLVWGNLDGVFIFRAQFDSQQRDEAYYLNEGENFFNIASLQNIRLDSLFHQNSLSCENVPYVSQSLDLAIQHENLTRYPFKFARTNIKNIYTSQELDMTCAVELGGLNFSKDGKYLVSGVDLWSIATGSIFIKGIITDQPNEESENIDDLDEEEENDAGDIADAITQISPNTDNPTAAVIAGRAVQVWNLENGKLLHLLDGHEGRVTDAIYSADGKIIITSGLDETIRLWNVDTGGELAIMPGYTAEDLIISPDGELLITVSGDTARFWPLTISADGQTAEFHNKLTGKPEETLSGIDGVYRLSPDGQYFTYLACIEKVGSHCINQFVNLLHTDTKYVEAHRFLGAKELIQDFVFSFDGKLIAIVSDNTIEIWEVDTETKLHRLVGDPLRAENIQEMYFTPDSALLITQVSNKLLRFWDVEIGDVIDEQIYSGLRSWAISSDQRKIAVIIGNNIRILGIEP